MSYVYRLLVGLLRYSLIIVWFVIAGRWLTKSFPYSELSSVWTVAWFTRSSVTAEIARVGGHYTVQSHSRSPILVPIKIPYQWRFWGLHLGGGSGVAIIAAGEHEPILPQWTTRNKWYIMLYHKLHWGATGGGRIFTGGAPLAPSLNRPCPLSDFLVSE